MFDDLFSYPAVLKRHREGPLAAERAAYLKGLAAQGVARATILRQASYCLCVARELEAWPPDYRFDKEEIDGLASAWAARRTERGRASSPRWPEEQFHFAAIDFLRSSGRLRAPPCAQPGPYDKELTDFIATQQQGPWQSQATCLLARWQVLRFLDYLNQRRIPLHEVGPSHVDAYFTHMSQRWSRSSLRTSAKMLRSWFSHCQRRGWARPGLAGTIITPRVYRHEGLPLGPSWAEIGRVLVQTAGNEPAQLRDHAVILLLSVYGLRSGEVRRLRLDDINWHNETIHIVRSKTSRQITLPLEPSVGNAITRYLRNGRPSSDKRVVFLTLRAPHRPLSAGGLYNVVRHHFSKVASSKRGRGPHGLRHACARHLVECGHSFKELGDHLGHRSPDATRIYAKVDLASLRRVAFDDLGGLA